MPFTGGEAERAFFEELPTILSASRLPQLLNEAPGAVSILDRDFIRATGYRDVARLLRLVPGMQVGQERGHAQWVTYHGLGSDYPSSIQVLIDGRSVHAPSSFGGVDWAALPLSVDEIERIEIVRGTNSNTYGANAFLGVVNIITRHSQLDQGVTLRSNLGSHQIGDLQASWNARGDGYGLRLAASQLRDHGFSKVFDSQEKQILSLRSDHRLSGVDELTVRGGHVHMLRGMGYPDSLFGNNAERTGVSENTSVHLTWRRALAVDEEWLTSLYHYRENGIDRWNAAAPSHGYPSVPLNRNRYVERTNLELQHRFALNPQARVVWGVDGRVDKADGAFLFADGPPPTTRMYRAFSNVDWRITPTWQLNLGGLIEKNGPLVPQFVPRVFLNWQVSPSDTLRAGYSRAWQQRNTFDIYGDIKVFAPNNPQVLLAQPYQPNTNLRVPRIDSFEVGYLGRFRPLDSTLDVRLFQENITDFVVRRLVPGVGVLPYLPTTYYTNLDSMVRVHGVEYQLRARPRQGTELLLNHTLIHRSSSDSEVVRRTAPFSASLSWLQNYQNGWSSTLSVLRMGPQGGGYGYVFGCDYATRDYTTADLRIARGFHVDGHKAEIALNGINLGARHQEIPDRSEQCLPTHLGSPVNPVAPMGWLSFLLEL